MRLVLAALGRPLTVIVALIAIIAGFFMAVGRMRMDIFPEVGNPVIYVAQPYGGMTPHRWKGSLPTITSTTSSTSQAFKRWTARAFRVLL
jgi:multidrug efflux pump subunit AcrB